MFLTAYIAHVQCNCNGVDASNLQTTLVQVLTWCREATSNYHSQWWPGSVSLFGVTWPQWIYTPTLYKLRCNLNVDTTVRFGCALHWRHNEPDGVSNHQPHDCLLNLVFRHRSNKTSEPRVTGLCAGNSPVTCEFPAQRIGNSENLSIRWRHHGFKQSNLNYGFFNFC